MASDMSQIGSLVQEVWLYSVPLVLNLGSICRRIGKMIQNSKITINPPGGCLTSIF
jgi:hypothetical protein